jgi:hypothetical protein
MLLCSRSALKKYVKGQAYFDMNYPLSTHANITDFTLIKSELEGFLNTYYMIAVITILTVDSSFESLLMRRM